MDGLISAGLLNAAVATLLAGLALAVTAGWKNPYVARLAWLAVLLKLLTPPLLFVPVEVAWLQPSVSPTSPLVVEPIAIEPAEAQPPVHDVASSATTAAAPATSSDLPSIATPIASAAPTAPLPAATPYSFPFTPLQTLAVLWLTGSVLLSHLSVTRIIRLRRCLARALPCPAPLEQRTASLAAELGLHAPPTICIVPGRVAPFAWSLGRRATIVVPAALVASLDADALDAVIAHELTHLRRRDGWARWLELAATIAYWWCPTVWFARRRLHTAEEECCDADVLRKFPALRRGYGQALLQTLDLLAGDAPLAPGATGWGSRRSLRRRFERIGKVETASSLPPTSHRLAWGMIAFVCVTTPLIASEESAPKEPTSANRPSLIGAPPDYPAFSEGKGNLRRCTITLEDGAVIKGVLVNDDERRLVVERSKSYATRAEAFKRSNDHAEWGLSLEECIHLAVTNHPNFRALNGSEPGAPLVLTQSTQDRQSRALFESGIAQLTKDITNKYWELARCYQHVDARQDEQRAAFSLTELAKSKQKSEPAKISSEDLKRIYAHYTDAGERRSDAMTELYAVESELRWLMGLAQQDGRIISPNSTAPPEERNVNWHAAYDKALANRVELREQRKRVTEEERRYQSLGKAIAECSDAEQRQDLENRRSHCRMLADRESGVLKRMENSIGPSLEAAIRELATTSASVMVQVARDRAVEEEQRALRELFASGKIGLDVLQVANEREADLTCSRHSWRQKHRRATTEFDYQQGTLLEAHGIRIAE